MYSIICLWGVWSDCVGLQMITKNFEDYPEHRLKFFSLLRAIATYCFPALIRLSSQVLHKHFPLFWVYITSSIITFAFSSFSLNEIHYYFHLGRGVFSSAIKACYGFNYMGISAYGEEYCWNWAQSIIGNAKKFSGAVFWCIPFLHILIYVYGVLYSKIICFFMLQASEFCNQFYRTYFLTIEQEIFAVLTDTFHKPGFKLHVLVLQHLFCLVMFRVYATTNIMKSFC